MKAVLIVAHGSSNKDSNHMFFEILNMVRELSPEIIIEGAFMSFSDLNIEISLQDLINRGATEIDIIPYLLFSGHHVIETIPEKVNNFLGKDSLIKINYKSSLGLDRRLAEIIVDRINE